jgi:hypothetical protein
MEGVREPLRTGTLLGVHNTCGSRVRFFSHAFDVHLGDETGGESGAAPS